LFVVERAEVCFPDRKTRHPFQKFRRLLLQAMPQTATAGPPVRHLAHHLFVQGIAPAFRLLVLLGQFNHLLLQFHQPTIRLEVIRDLFHPWIFISALKHAP
jgi:hypothetical protein